MAGEAFVSEIRYATLADAYLFTVKIYKVGKRFKLIYGDMRPNSDSSYNRINQTKWFETQGAADEFIRLFNQGAK